MTATKKHLSPKGFTIIETLIVLALATVILMTVFLYVPSARRNARNDKQRADALLFLQGMKDYVTTNDGKLPRNSSISGNTITITGFPGSTPVTINISQDQTTLYTTIAPIALGTCNNVILPHPDASHAYIYGYTGCKCDQSNSATVASNVEGDMVVLYHIETNADFATQCLATVN
jgi:prepilin-type N-terminal cleavage/methylation domain-containing protein